MKCDVYSDAASFGTLAEEWTKLLTAVPGHSIFATPEWTETCWRAFGEGHDLCLMTVRDGMDLVGVVPLSVAHEGERRVVRFLAYQEVTDYEDIVARPGLEDAVWQQALAYLSAQPWDLDLHNIPAASPTIDSLRRLGAASGYAVTVECEDVCPLIAPLPADFETYLDSLDKKARHELRRKLRRLTGDEDTGAEITWRRDDLVKAMDDFVRLHRLSSVDKDAFMTPSMIAFFNDVAQMCQQRGWLCLAFLSVHGVPVSTIMAFEYGQTFYLYNSGYDPDYEYMSAGLLLKALAIEHAIKSGMTCYDFLQGNERYKYDLGGKDTTVCRVQCVPTAK